MCTATCSGQLNGNDRRVPAAHGTELGDFPSAWRARTDGTRRAPAKAKDYPPFEHVDLYHQGESHLRSDLRRSDAGRRRHVASVLPACGVAEPSRAGGAVRHLRPILRQRRGEYAGTPVVDGRVRHRLPEKTMPDIYRFKRPERDGTGRRRRSRWPATYGMRRFARASRCATTASTPSRRADDAGPARTRGAHCVAAPYTNPSYPAFDMTVSDQHRTDVWIDEFRGYDESPGTCRRWKSCSLPGDHTAGARAGRRTPKRILRRQRPGARTDRRGALTVAFLAEHGGFRARGRLAGGTRPRRLPPFRDARDIGVEPRRRLSPLREHDRRAGDDRGNPGPGVDVAVRPFQSSVARDLDGPTRPATVRCADAGPVARRK